MSVPICAKTFKALRVALGQSLDYLAAKSGVSKSTISRIEKTKGIYRANVVQAERLARSLGVPISDLNGQAPKHLLPADGDFLPIRIMTFRPSWLDGALRLRQVMRDERQAGDVSVALAEPTPDIIYFRRSSGIVAESA